MHTRFIAEGKPGVTSRRGANYSTWWNGGLRTTAYFHNQIGILTETIGSPTPGQTIPFTANRHIADSNNFFAIAPQPWKFRQSIDYSITANRAILDLASRYRETRALPHLQDGFGLHQVGQRRSLDVHAAQARADSGGDARCRRRLAAALAVRVVAAAVAAVADGGGRRRRRGLERLPASGEPRSARLHPAGRSRGLRHVGTLRRTR